MSLSIEAVSYNHFQTDHLLRFPASLVNVRKLADHVLWDSGTGSVAPCAVTFASEKVAATS